jgi:hypothetical protein
LNLIAAPPLSLDLGEQFLAAGLLVLLFTAVFATNLKMAAFYLLDARRQPGVPALLAVAFVECLAAPLSFGIVLVAEGAIPDVDFPREILRPLLLCLAQTVLGSLPNQSLLPDPGDRLLGQVIRCLASMSLSLVFALVLGLVHMIFSGIFVRAGV